MSRKTKQESKFDWKAYEDALPYGLCPQCGAPGVSRERRPDGDDKCANGHAYKSGEGMPAVPRIAEVGEIVYRLGIEVDKEGYGTATIDGRSYRCRVGKMNIKRPPREVPARFGMLACVPGPSGSLSIDVGLLYEDKP